MFVRPAGPVCWGQIFMSAPASSEAAHKVFVRACTALEPAHWAGQDAALRAVDEAGWETISALAVRHGLTGLVARGLDWARDQTGIEVPILARLTAWRQGQLIQLLKHRSAARRVTEGLAAEGVRFGVWERAAYEGAPKWEGYYYLDYDQEADRPQ